MTIALISILVIAVFAAGFLLWKSRDTWRWFHITASAITLLLAIALLFPTAGVLKSRSAWSKVKETLDVRLAKIEKEQDLLKFGDPNDPANTVGVFDLQLQLKKFTVEAGRRWPSLKMQANAPASITLQRVAPVAELPPGVEAPPAEQPAAAAPAAAAAALPLIPQGLIVYGFAESMEQGVPTPIPTFFLGEFKVTASGPNEVTIAPTTTLEAPQQQAISSGQAQTWTLYELLPLDGHEPFVAIGSEPADDAVFGRVDDELVKRLFAKGVSQPTINKYLRDGGRTNPDDTPATRWVKIEFNKVHSVVVDSLEKRSVLDGGFFDPTGQAVDSRLQRGGEDVDKGVVKFKITDQVTVKEEVANALVDEGVAKLLDTYYVRELNDYRFALRRIRLRISELTIRQAELEFEAKVLNDAIDATKAMLAVNQDLKLKLEKDAAKIQVEKTAITAYSANVTMEVAATKQRLVGIYRNNIELAAELQQLHSGIDAKLP